MKNKYLVIALAFVLIFAGTAFVTYAQAVAPFQGNFDNMRQMMEQQGIDYEYMGQMMNQEGTDFEGMRQLMEQQGIDYDQMNEIMTSGDFEAMQELMENQNVNFGQMQQYMEQVHPEIDTTELKELYENCNGTIGSQNSNNFMPKNTMMNN